MLDADVDVIHDHTVTGPIRSLGRPGPPVVTTNHGPFDGPMSSIYRALGDDVAIVAISHHQASTARGLPLAAVIHHGLDLDAVPVGRGDGGYALFLGRMCPNKGVHTAAGVAREAGIPLRIAAKIRDDDERGYFASKVEPLLGGGVEFVGEATPDEKWELLRHALCLLNPIAWPEPFGMVMIEALAAGTPVVATPCGAAPEIVDHGITGFLRAGEKALVAALLAVDRLDRTECRRVAEARFSGARLTADHLLLYERVLACRAVRA
jgi:glycosyltransferase involved in cell wall biosynthesis